MSRVFRSFARSLALNEHIWWQRTLVVTYVRSFTFFSYIINSYCNKEPIWAHWNEEILNDARARESQTDKQTENNGYFFIQRQCVAWNSCILCKLCIFALFFGNIHTHTLREMASWMAYDYIIAVIIVNKSPWWSMRAWLFVFILLCAVVCSFRIYLPNITQDKNRSLSSSHSACWRTHSNSTIHITLTHARTPSFRHHSIIYIKVSIHAVIIPVFVLHYSSSGSNSISHLISSYLSPSLSLRVCVRLSLNHCALTQNNSKFSIMLFLLCKFLHLYLFSVLFLHCFIHSDLSFCGVERCSRHSPRREIFSGRLNSTLSCASTYIQSVCVCVLRTDIH